MNLHRVKYGLKYFGKYIQISRTPASYRLGSNRRVIADVCIAPILYEEALKILYKEGMLVPRGGKRKEENDLDWYVEHELNSAINGGMVIIK
ncbi:hypothetical protein [Vogesella indigofera]|uniref:hypothetical protein n=1 Tax=Vogesella indigofera TaxID=45465 RepID=UPI00234F5F23|nr:hypothetical protein [Vogesella indigofera]MDC7708445.1 hypothetical protein [Vogesella indigofera]